MSRHEFDDGAFEAFDVPLSQRAAALDREFSEPILSDFTAETKIKTLGKYRLEIVELPEPRQ